ncbi:hypothetical protein KUCAC02_006638, partial [Chaenocephalus aceratus]
SSAVTHTSHTGFTGLDDSALCPQLESVPEREFKGTTVSDRPNMESGNRAMTGGAAEREENDKTFPLCLSVFDLQRGTDSL